MKILYLASRFPYPLEKGDKLRVYHHLRELSALGHLVTLCALNEHPVPDTHIAALAPFCHHIEIIRISRWNILKQLPNWLWRNLPLQVGYFYTPAAAHKIKSLHDKIQPDLVWTQLVRMAEYTQQLGQWRVLDIMDALSANTARWATTATWWLRPILRREARLLAQYEQKTAANFNSLFIISQQDAQLLPLLPNDQHKLMVLPNGVELDYFNRNALPLIPITHDIAFVGNMGYAPNIAAAKYLAQQIMPIIWASAPQTTLLLAGARPHKDIAALAKDPRITVSGWLEDIRHAYCSTHMLIAPLFIGSGQQNKILEAMALNLPCITTPLVNNAIHATPEHEILLADNPADFAQQYFRLANSPALRQSLGLHARQFVTARYGWSAYMRDAMTFAEN